MSELYNNEKNLVEIKHLKEYFNVTFPQVLVFTWEGRSGPSHHRADD